MTIVWPNFHPAKLLTLNLESGAVVDGEINEVYVHRGICCQVTVVCTYSDF